MGLLTGNGRSDNEEEENQACDAHVVLTLAWAAAALKVRLDRLAVRLALPKTSSAARDPPPKPFGSGPHPLCPEGRGIFIRAVPSSYCRRARDAGLPQGRSERQPNPREQSFRGNAAAEACSTEPGSSPRGGLVARYERRLLHAGKPRKNGEFRGGNPTMSRRAPRPTHRVAERCARAPRIVAADRRRTDATDCHGVARQGPQVLPRGHAVGKNGAHRPRARRACLPPPGSSFL
jgi:hypothetical protein